MLFPGATNTVDLHQEGPVWIELIWGMTPSVKASAVLLFVSAVAAGPVSDTVNERIPVTGVELEAHWGVDCAATVNLLVELVTRAKAGEGCLVSPLVRQQLQLCSFIYQTPGSDTGHVCPDYRAALEALGGAGPDDGCQQIAMSLPGPEHCSPSGQAE